MRKLVLTQLKLKVKKRERSTKHCLPTSHPKLLYIAVGHYIRKYTHVHTPPARQARNAHARLLIIMSLS